MLDAISLSLGGVAGTDKTTQGAKDNLATTYSQFLTLLTTQLKNQDPLDPMDSKDMTNQLIQLSNTEQQIAQTDKLNQLLEVNQSTAVNMALNYIGKEIDYVGGDMQYNGNPVGIKYYMEGDAKQAKVSIADDKGNVVFTADIDGKAGGHSYKWDGKDKDGNLVPKGNYVVSIGAADAANKAVASTVIVPTIVSGVETTNGQVMLLTGSRAVSIASVQAVRTPNIAADVPAATTPSDNSPSTPSSSSDDTAIAA